MTEKKVKAASTADQNQALEALLGLDKLDVEVGGKVLTLLPLTYADYIKLKKTTGLNPRDVLKQFEDMQKLAEDSDKFDTVVGVLYEVFYLGAKRGTQDLDRELFERLVLPEHIFQCLTELIGFFLRASGISPKSLVKQ